MFDNLTKEIFIYSVIPVAIMVFIVLLLLFIGKKKDNDYYKYNYAIKILLNLIIGLVLPLIIGYTIWVFLRFANRGIIMANIIYIVILLALIIALIFLFIVVCRKMFNGLRNSEEEYYVE